MFNVRSRMPVTSSLPDRQGGPAYRQVGGFMKHSGIKLYREDIAVFSKQ